MQTEQLPILDRRTGATHWLELSRSPGGVIVVRLDGVRVKDGPRGNWEAQATKGAAHDIWMEWCRQEGDSYE